MTEGKMETDYVAKTDTAVSNFKSWLFDECKKSGLTLSDFSAKIIENCVRDAIQNRIISPWETLISLHPEASVHQSCSFLENPVLHLTEEYGYSITKCPKTADFPFKGVAKRLYLATGSGIYYVWKPDLGNYIRFFKVEG